MKKAPYIVSYYNAQDDPSSIYKVTEEQKQDLLALLEKSKKELEQAKARDPTFGISDILYGPDGRRNYGRSSLDPNGALPNGGTSPCLNLGSGNNQNC